MGYPPPNRDWMGIRRSGDREIEQLRDGRYASYIHAGGLSCNVLSFRVSVVLLVLLLNVAELLLSVSFQSYLILHCVAGEVDGSVVN